VALSRKLFPKMDDLEIWVSMSTQGKSENRFELAAYGFLFALQSPCNMVTFFWPFGHNTAFIAVRCQETDDLEIWVSRSTQVRCKDGF